jgi:hypothetical protein
MQASEDAKKGRKIVRTFEDMSRSSQNPKSP